MPTWTGCWGQPGGSGAKRVRISWICALVVGGWPRLGRGLMVTGLA